MRELPDDDRLRIMAQVATTCALEGQGDAYKIFARLLYQYLTDTQPFFRETKHSTSPQNNEPIP